ncbi:unnamed protein product, partial [Caenorhabditis brenneri]
RNQKLLFKNPPNLSPVSCSLPFNTMQFNLFHLLLVTILAVVFISSPVQSVPHSEQDIEALMGLQEQVNEYLGSSKMSPEAKKKIEDMMAKKQAGIEKSFGKK